MASEPDVPQIISALSARVMALEGALAALAPCERAALAHVLANYDAFANELLERYGGLPVDEQFLETLHQSFADIRALLAYRADDDAQS